MGLSLGLIGGGGSILTVPIPGFISSRSMPYSRPPTRSLSGLTSLIGSFSHMRFWEHPLAHRNRIRNSFDHQRLPDARLCRTGHPDPSFIWATRQSVKHMRSCSLFAVIMLLASYSMICKRVVMENEEAEPRQLSP